MLVCRRVNRGQPSVYGNSKGRNSTTFRFFPHQKQQVKQRNQRGLLFSFFPIKKQFPTLWVRCRKKCLLPKVLVLGHVHLGLKQQPVQGLGKVVVTSSIPGATRILCVQTFQNGDTLPLKQTANLHIGKWMVGR